jgi:hypothetical protein
MTEQEKKPGAADKKKNFYRQIAKGATLAEAHARVTCKDLKSIHSMLGIKQPCKI